MTFKAPTLDMTIVDSPDVKNDAVWLEGTRPAGCAPTCETHKVVHRLLQLRAKSSVGLLVMTRLAAALWPSHGSSRGATGRGVGGVGLAWLVISFT